MKSKLRFIWNALTGSPEGAKLGSPGDLVWVDATQTLWIKAHPLQRSPDGWLPIVTGSGGTGQIAGATVNTGNTATFEVPPQGITAAAIVGANSNILRLTLETPRLTNAFTVISTVQLDGLTDPFVGRTTPTAGSTVDIVVQDRTGTPVDLTAQGGRIVALVTP